MIPSAQVNLKLFPNITKESSREQKQTICGIAGLVFLLAVIGLLSYSSFYTNDTGHAHVHSVFDLESENVEADVYPIIGSSYYYANGEDDLMDYMPLLREDSCAHSPTDCGFNQYSGYLLATDNNEIHYWFVEADVEGDPMEKPLFFWTNGGPGCSGMEGLLVEEGPWRILSEDGELYVQYNPYTWIREVNMVFLEQPYGVGFSVVHEGKDPVAGDWNAAVDMDAVIRDFIKKFPRFEDHPIYTTAESWGGHYVPMTAWRILTNNDAGATPYINYKGFFLGNPYTDYYENFYGFIESVYGHGLMKATDYFRYRANCYDNAVAVNDSMVCDLVYVGAYYSSYNSDVYALDWPQCPFAVDWTSEDTPTSHLQSSHIHFKAMKSMDRILSHHDYESLDIRISKNDLREFNSKIKMMFDPDSSTGSKLKADSTIFTVDKGDDDGYSPCLDRHERLFLRLDEVQAAIHVKPYKWAMCALKVYADWPKSDYYTYMQKYYEDIIENYSMKYNLSLLIYSGDDDSVCGTGGTQYWLDNWPGYSRDDDINWVPWRDGNDQLGGYHTIIKNDDYPDFNALHLLTIRTAGHMVPIMEPQRSLKALWKYLYEFSDYESGGVDGY